MFRRKKSTKVAQDGRMYLTNRRRRRSFPLTGFLFVMVCLWSAKALMLAQNTRGYATPADIILDIQRPLQTLQSLVFYPDPVTVWLAEAVGSLTA